MPLIHMKVYVVDDIIARIRYTPRVCTHKWKLGDINPEPPDCEVCTTLKVAADIIQQLRDAIDQFVIAEREHRIATEYPNTMTEQDVNATIKDYNVTLGNLRKLSHTRYRQ